MNKSDADYIFKNLSMSMKHGDRDTRPVYLRVLALVEPPEIQQMLWAKYHDSAGDFWIIRGKTWLYMVDDSETPEAWVVSRSPAFGGSGWAEVARYTKETTSLDEALRLGEILYRME